MTITILVGDVLQQLRKLPDKSVHCLVTSPPYWGLRDYGVAGQLGLEPTLGEFISNQVLVFAEAHRVLRDDGTCWINMGDSYWSRPNGSVGATTIDGSQAHAAAYRATNALRKNRPPHASFKHKDLMMVPHRLAIALQDWGWYVRSDVVWNKPNPMPESVRDRPTKSHEYIFLLSKTEHYYYDADAIREPVVGDVDADDQGREMKAGSQAILTGWATGTDGKHSDLDGNFTKFRGSGGVSAPGYDEQKWETRHDGYSRPPMTMYYREYHPGGRNKRTVWTMATHSFKEAHFATFPPELPRTCIRAGTSEKGHCPQCGNRWVRDVERKPMVMDKSERNDVRGTRIGTSGTMLEPPSAITTGWSPTCECGLEPVPDVVLDIYFGAGTTGLEADRLQRDCIGIELNPAYAEIAKKRLKSDAALFCDVRIVEGQPVAA